MATLPLSTLFRPGRRPILSSDLAHIFLSLHLASRCHAPGQTEAHRDANGPCPERCYASMRCRLIDGSYLGPLRTDAKGSPQALTGEPGGSSSPRQPPAPPCMKPRRAGQTPWRLPASRCSARGTAFPSLGRHAGTMSRVSETAGVLHGSSPLQPGGDMAGGIPRASRNPKGSLLSSPSTRTGHRLPPRMPHMSHHQGWGTHNIVNRPAIVEGISSNHA